MAINIRLLEQAATRAAPSNLAKSLQEARMARKRTAFLSHSHHDASKAKGLQILLAENGWDIFIDWEHNSLDERPTKETAQWLQEAIVRADWLIYLATPNSQKSRWCPWEIGYADGKKSAASILIVSTEDANGTYGSEYLSLYKQISTTVNSGPLALFEAGNNSSGKYLKDVTTEPPRY